VCCDAFITNQIIKYIKNHNTSEGFLGILCTSQNATAVTGQLQRWSQGDLLCAVQLQKYGEAMRILCQRLFRKRSISETSVNFYQTTRHNIPEDSHLRTPECFLVLSHFVILPFETDQSTFLVRSVVLTSVTVQRRTEAFHYFGSNSPKERSKFADNLSVHTAYNMLHRMCVKGQLHRSA
jgi:hypothetical protein